MRLHFYPTGEDTSDTDWELIPQNGKSKRLKATTIKPLVVLKPDWVRVLQVNDGIKSEVTEYIAFAKKEAKDLAEYERLKKKFE